MKTIKIFVTILLILPASFFAQNTERDDLGSWYMYVYNAKFGKSQFGVQGDFQYRNWNIFGDTEQILLRSGFTYTPKDTNVVLTLGFANITTGIIGENAATTNENRIYQEALLSQKVGNRIYINHRFRFEQRFAQNQDFRTRYRYNLMVNIPVNKKDLSKNALYGAFYNELFINGERNIGANRSVSVFDRNRLYFGLGYVVAKTIRVQVGWMKQTTDAFAKDQLQFSMIQTF